jgi:hypothetical protein
MVEMKGNSTYGRVSYVEGMSRGGGVKGCSEYGRLRRKWEMRREFK